MTNQQFCKYCGKVVVLIKSTLGFDDVVHTHSGEIYCDFPSGAEL
jgi:hypothetical protein